MSEPTQPQRPNPTTIHHADQFVAALRQLRTWAGEPSLRRLTALAGKRRLPNGRLVDALPSSTLSDNLGGGRLPRLPRRSFVAAFVTACMRARGCSDEEIAAEIPRWQQALRRISQSDGSSGTAPANVSAAAPTVAAPPVEAPPAQPAASLSAPPKAASPVTSFGAGTTPAASAQHQAAHAQRGKWRRLRVYAAAVTLLALGGAAGFVIGTADDDPPQTQAAAPPSTPASSPSSTTTSPPPSSPAPQIGIPAGQQAAPPTSASKPRPTGSTTNRGLPAAGWYTVRPGHTQHLGYCWGEGRERNGRTNRILVTQQPCASKGKRTKLVPLGGGVYRLEWHSSQFGVGCISVDFGDRATRPEALLAPQSCDYGGNRFRLEPYGGGYRLRPVHSGLCVGALRGARDTGVGAEATQKSCTGGADQWFTFSP